MNLSQAFGFAGALGGESNYLCTGFKATLCLLHRRLDVVGVSVRHGLHTNGKSGAYTQRSYHRSARLSTLIFQNFLLHGTKLLLFFELCKKKRSYLQFFFRANFTLFTKSAVFAILDITKWRVVLAEFWGKKWCFRAFMMYFL